ncbi:MAG: hypothetical protein OJF50_000727 [Nitrospira sp.]|jgi:hypothetical protein|nr:hypothetical protein [Nitrospira sp.]
MLDSPEPFSPVNLAWLLYRQSHRWLCKDVMHDGNQILPIERLGQKGEGPAFDPMAFQFFVGIS